MVWLAYHRVCPAGTYTIVYTLCEKLNPTNCQDATITVPISAAPVVATNDVFSGINGATGNPNVGNAFLADTVNGQPATLTNATLAVNAPAVSILALQLDHQFQC